jgi:HEAT repeat protein
VRRAAAQALGAISPGERAGTVIDKLLPLLADSDREVRSAAAQALAAPWLMEMPSREGDVDVTTAVAMCDLEDRIASDYETGFSEQALRQLMKEAFLLEMERKRREAMLSEVAPLAIHR